MPMVEALGMTGWDVTIQGRTIRLSAWTFEIQASFERFLRARATRLVREMMEGAPPNERQEMWSTLQQDFAKGMYGFGWRTAWDAMHMDREALAHLFWLQASKNHPDLTEQQIREWTEDDQTRGMMLDACIMANPTIRAKLAGTTSASLSPEATQAMLSESSPASSSASSSPSTRSNS